MSIPAPHFHLFSEAQAEDRQGQWRFVLQAADGSATFEAADYEPDLGSERLELLAVVRGLEALDQPSRVTLFTPSRYVSRGLAYGLDDWRGNGWTWECFGAMVPVKNRDLWQRVDRALDFHRVDLRGHRFDFAQPRSAIPAPHFSRRHSTAAVSEVLLPGRRSESGLRRVWSRLQRGLRRRAEDLRLTCCQLGTCFLPKPWLD